MLPPPIADYAVIGDCRSAALISREGSIDWLCLPRFDSPSVFASILDPDRGGRFLIRPTGPSTVVRRYIEDTNVLETTFTTASGVLRTTDVMPVDSEAAKARELWPDHEILRRIECLAGEVQVQVLFAPRFEYGRIPPRIDSRRAGLFYCEHGARELSLATDMPLAAGAEQRTLAGAERLTAGGRRYFSMTYAHAMPGVLAPLGAEADRRIERSIAWWQEWAAACRYQGPYRQAVMRSALVLKLLSYSPSGAIIAAPTTSLPEKIGGVRNWDYRYCWLRDASLTLRALCDLGFEVEAESFLSWLLHATHLTWPRVRMVYGVFGESKLAERELTSLSGYQDSRRVRIGNLAAEQLQLDTYGELLESAFVWLSRGGTLDRASRSNLVELGRAVCQHWREPDDGIWERRAGRRHHTHSKVMCWLALDRLLKLHASGHLRVPEQDFSRERDALRVEIEGRGFNGRLGSYVSAFDGDEVDASLLVLPLHGYTAADSSRMRSTCDRIRECLGVDSLLFRYRESDGLPAGEGAFGICGFWETECRVLQNRRAAAGRQFEDLLGMANDLGLFAEEIDPHTHAALGNFPQALTHVGLINAALTLEQADRA
ncbi:MAG TPA: glycoside hydrolase family 15 protein [Vicinamibacterales bacterium]|nr:glycoside hydrolase family 15 protein [Vicinamibacterales bacterium]HWI16342.1 glycoside hydrolase family 15 protein [Vicinamibacterales bacterium]